MGRLLLLYVDDALDDTLPFGSVRRQAFSIMPKVRISGKLNARFGEVEQARREVLRSA
ncbi:hypothetical protein AB3X93_40125 [Paraburkholderia sp. BR14262]|uniref:hypothetical protein n=1 Tax=unclassified Paraburkholderia TaxID=2615204 RepID=UPI0034CD301C